MSHTSAQYHLDKAGGSFRTVSVAHPTPEDAEVCIRTKAIGLNPLDWKSHELGIMVQAWPAVLGADASGVVDAVGSSVKDFQVGDEVFMACGGGGKGGAYQEIITVPSIRVAKKPASLTFEEAASLPICYLTAACAIHQGLHIGLPHMGQSVGGTSSVKSVLVPGASSAVGAAVVQLLRLTLPSATIIATSSPAHHEHLKSLGATACFDRSAQSDAGLLKSATPGGLGVDAIVDPVEAAAGQPELFDVLNPSGPKLYSFVFGGKEPKAPEGVNATQIFGRAIFEAENGQTVMPALARIIEDGKYKLPLKVEVVGKGFESIEQGLKKVKSASGTKYVVSL